MTVGDMKEWLQDKSDNIELQVMDTTVDKCYEIVDWDADSVTGRLVIES